MAGKVVLNDIAADTMELLVSWMYNTVDKPLTLPQAVDLFQASDRFDVLDLHQACKLIIPELVFDLNPIRPDLLVYRLWQFAAAIGSDAIVQVSMHSSSGPHSRIQFRKSSCRLNSM